MAVLRDYTFRVRWFWGLTFGVGFYAGTLFILLGPVQFEIERDPIWDGTPF